MPRPRQFLAGSAARFDVVWWPRECRTACVAARSRIHRTRCHGVHPDAAWAELSGSILAFRETRAALVAP